MKKIYHLSSCSTCQRIIKDLSAGQDVKLQDIKAEPITETQLEEMKELSGSYESLFSRKAMKFREWKLNEKSLSENDMRDLILKEYTFLKRPVMILDGKIFIGNSPAVVKEAKEYLGR